MTAHPHNDFPLFLWCPVHRFRDFLLTVFRPTVWPPSLYSKAMGEKREEHLGFLIRNIKCRIENKPSWCGCGWEFPGKLEQGSAACFRDCWISFHLPTVNSLWMWVVSWAAGKDCWISIGNDCNFRVYKICVEAFAVSWVLNDSKTHVLKTWSSWVALLGWQYSL